MSSGGVIPAGTVTMLFTDIEGSTRLLKQLGDGYGQVLTDHREILRAAFAARVGREMDTQGDAFFYAFARARDAALAAVEAQRALAAHEWPDGTVCRVRMGLHTGEPSVGEEGYHGIGLHRGARIASAAHGGQILVSSTTAELLSDDLPEAVTLRDLGLQWLKDIDRPERIYQLVAPGLTSDFPPPRTSASPPARRHRGLVAAAAVLTALAVSAAAVLLTRGSGPTVASAAAVTADSVGVFDATRGGLTGQVDVGAAPSAIAVGEESVWVANSDAGTVSRIDPAKGTTIQTITVGSSPSGIAVGDGFVWVANGLDATVSKIDPATNSQVDTIGVGNGPSGVAVGRRYVWVANGNDRTVSRIDPRTDTVLPPIPVGPGADGIAVGGGSVWVTSSATGQATKIDERTGRVIDTVDVGSGPQALAVAPGAVWVANRLGGTVSRIDPATDDVRATVPVGDGPNGIAVGPDAIWAANELSGTLTKIDPARNVPEQTVHTGNRPEGVALSKGQMFVAVQASGTGHLGGTLTVLGDKKGDASFDPAITYSALDTQMLALTNDGLVGFRRVGGTQGAQLVADLATSLPAPTDGGLQYSFHLRPGIRYSTGALVRPEDIRRGIERSVAAQAKNGGGGGSYANIVGAKACTKRRCDLAQGIEVDEATRTITFHLTAPNPDFLYFLALSYTYAVPAGTPLAVQAPLPATGPYRIAAYNTKNGGYRLVRNRYFHEWAPAAQPQGFPDVIVRRSVGTPAADVAAVLAGKADLEDGQAQLPPSLLRQLQTQHASRLIFAPLKGTFYAQLNPTLPPFNDLRVRQAVNFAVDRKRLMELTGGAGEVTCQPLPPNSDAYRAYCPYTVDPNKAGTWTAPDLARARRLVAASGTKGEPVTVYIPSYWPFGDGGARYLVSVLDGLGYRARYGGVVDYNKLMDKGTQIQAGFAGWAADYANPGGFFDNGLTCAAYKQKLSNGAAIGGFCDPAIDREMARAHALQDTDPRQASILWRKVDHDITDAAPWVAYSNPGWYQLLSKRTGNFRFNPEYGTLLDQLWVR